MSYSADSGKMTRYQTYGPADFATDESFIRWIREGGAEGDSYWHSVLEEVPEKEEDIREAIRIVRQLSFRTRAVEAEKIDRIWKQIEGKTKENAGTQPDQAKRRPLWSAQNLIMAAAAIAILLIGFFFFVQQPQKVHTAYGQQQQHILPDGSLVYLNADSRITYHEGNWPKDRALELSGEAFFEVAKGSAFVVQTDFGTVRVLGTSFNVRARHVLDVSCFTGLVEVLPINHEPVKLEPGHRVYQEERSDALIRETFIPDDLRYWRRGELTFSATRLEEVFEELERSFDIRIGLPASANIRRFTGSVKLNDVEAALEDVCLPMQLRFEKQENGYRILD